MKDVIEYNGSVDSTGILKITNRKQFDSDLKRFNGSQVEIVVKKKRSIRSSQQNRYYFGVVIPLLMQGLNDVGYDYNKKETHEFVKTNFNYTEQVNESTGEVIRHIKRTSRLNKSEFSEMVEKIKIFASEYLNIYIPDPNEDLSLFKN